MNDFTKGNAARQIVLFALPMLIGNIFQQFYSMADTVMVGRYVSGSALAAVGTAGTVTNFIISVLIGLTTGASIVISQFFGAKHIDNLKRSVSTSIISLAFLSIAVSVLGYIFTPAILRALNVPEDIFKDTADYLRIIMAGLIFPVYYNMYNAYLRALGDSKKPLYFLIFSTLTNVFLDYIFIVNLNMGVKGAAYATIISQTLAAILVILYANKYVEILKIPKLSFDKKLFTLILKYSIPSALQMSLTTLAALTITRLVSGFGSIAVAGYTSATKIDTFATLPLSNVSMATSTFVGQNMGAGLEDRAKEGFRSSMKLMIGMSILISALAIVFGSNLINLFVDAGDIHAEAIVSVGTQYLSIIAVFYILFGVFFAFNGFFRGAGDAVIVMVLTITSLSIRSICAHILVGSFGFGTEAVAWSIPVGWFLCSVFAWYYYKKRKWAGKVAVNK